MAPSKDDHQSDSIDSIDANITLNLSPINDLSSNNTETESSDLESSISSGHPELEEEKSCIPLDQNLKELLINITNTENLERVTSLKLRVISRETTLQHLNIYVPALRELNLNGSVISSLRDLGHVLKNLKILKINYCNLKCVDGVFAFENLEELFAVGNKIQDITPCAFMPAIKLLDFSKNRIENVSCLSYLNLCSNLRHLFLAFNPGLNNYRRMVQNMLPNLQTLDGVGFNQDLQVVNVEENNNANIIQISPRNISNTPTRNRTADLSNFTFSFPPRLFLDRSSLN